MWEVRESFFSSGDYPFKTPGCITSLHILLQINEQDIVPCSNQAEDLCALSPTFLFVLTQQN